MATREQRLISRRIDATDAEIELFIERFGKFLSVNLRKILRDIETGKDKALNAASALGSLRTTLERAGFKKELRQFEKIYGGQLDQVAEAFAEIKDPDELYTEVDRQAVEEIIKFDESAIANKVYQLTDSLSSTLMRQVITGAKLDTEMLIEEFGKKTAANIQTELRTATSGLYRSMTQAKAKEIGVEFLVYVGPDDGITREFCKARVDKIFTRAAVSKWDNGTPLPAEIYGGGYNCRHDLVPISREKAEQRVSEGTYAWG